MTEVQHLDWQLDGSFTVKSTPIVGIMMGSNYVTRTCLTVCSSKDQPSTTCQVRQIALVRLAGKKHAGMPCAYSCMAVCSAHEFPCCQTCSSM